MVDLTPQQRQVLEFVTVYLEMKGFAPSLQEIAFGLNLRSRSNIHRIVQDLKKKGMVKVKPLKFRTIRIADRSVKEMMAL
jgi:repressor LexA